MTTAVVHDRVPPGASEDELDTLIQVGFVTDALKSIGLDPSPIDFDYDIERFAETLRKAGPRLVFNLVETFGGRGQFISLAPTVCDYLGIPYTGCPAHAIFLSSHKLLAKKILEVAGIPTPRWASIEEPFGSAGEPSGRFVVKSVWEHASVGLEVADVRDGAELAGVLERANGRGRGAFFAERYIEGREFNISLLSRKGDVDPSARRETAPDVLAPAEMTFFDYPEGKPKVVDFRAKWERGSEEYESTVRSFEFAGEDGRLLGELGSLALRCWELFGLNGYARVDFRVDESGRPFVLEVNANPCISPDSGFIAAADHSGVSGLQVVERIVSRTVGGRAPVRRP